MTSHIGMGLLSNIIFMCYKREGDEVRKTRGLGNRRGKEGRGVRKGQRGGGRGRKDPFAQNPKSDSSVTLAVLGLASLSDTSTSFLPVTHPRLVPVLPSGVLAFTSPSSFFQHKTMPSGGLKERCYPTRLKDSHWRDYQLHLDYNNTLAVILFCESHCLLVPCHVPQREYSSVNTKPLLSTNILITSVLIAMTYCCVLSCAIQV